jgi:tetratricopeptide (TPR) repeat protein
MRNDDYNDLMQHARESFKEGKYAQAERVLQQVLLMNSRLPEVYHMLGTIYYDQGKFNKAIKTFRRALEIDPGFTDASVGLSIILNDLGKYEDGQKVFEEAQTVLAKSRKKGDPYMDEKLSVKHDELGELYFQYGRFDEALEQYLRALKLSTRKAEITMKVVECFVQKGDEERAIKELRLVIREYPKFIQARLRLGVLYYHAKKVLEAVEHWEGVLLRDPDNPEAKKYIRMAQETGMTALL